MKKLNFFTRYIENSRLWLSVIALLLASAAFSAEESFPEEQEWGTRQPTFSELDTNQDGFITRDEAEQWGELKENFDKIDKNDDGKIDRAEFRDFETQQIEKSIEEFSSSGEQ